MNNISRWLTKDSFFPEVGEIHLTNKCNLNCLSCWRKDQNINYSNELSEDNWLEIIDQLIELKIKELYLCGGGEPLIRKELAAKIIKKIKKYDIKGTLTTNLTLLDKNLIKLFVKSQWDHIQASIDGCNEETQDYLRGKKGTYRKNIQILNEFFKTKKKSKSKNPQISIHTVLNKENYKELSKIILLASRFNIDAVNLQELIPQSEYYDFLKIEKESLEVQKRIKDAIKVAQRKNITTNFQNFLVKKGKNEEKTQKILCLEPWKRITILSNGWVKTCCNSSKIHESIHKKDLRDIWYGKKFEKQRKKFYKGKLMRECCEHPNKLLGNI